MLWGDSNMIAAFQQTVVAGYANITLGFNESNEPSEANMDVGTAVAVWKQFIDPLKNEGYRLIAPATSTNPDRLMWMQQFLAECSDCQIDGIPIHYYGTTSDGMIEYIGQWSQEFDKPIWVTEFACQDFNSGQQCDESVFRDFYETTINFMERNSNVVAYFPFGFIIGASGPDQLINSDGTPTDLDSAIINLDFS